jgi:L-malate glycosyltransferase
VSARPTVMHVVLNLMPGGTERLVVEFARRMPNDVRSVVCCLDDSGPLADELHAAGVPVVALRRQDGFHPSLGARLARVAVDHDATLLHCHQYSPFVYGLIAAAIERPLPVVFTEHGRASDGPPSTKRRLVNPVLGRMRSAIYAVSGALRDHLIDEGFPANRVSVIHNGIDPGRRVTAWERAARRQELGLPANAVVFGTVARLDPVKDLQTLLAAFGRVYRAEPRSHLVIVGDGPEQMNLARCAVAHGLTRAVTFAGYHHDARRLLAAFDVYVNSSTYEGIPLTVLEGMAASLPVVATAVGGTPEVVNRETGLLVPARDARALAAGMLALLRSPRRTVLGQQGRERVETLFSMPRMLSRYLTIYRAMTDASAGWTRSSGCVASAGSWRWTGHSTPRFGPRSLP